MAQNNPFITGVIDKPQQNDGRYDYAAELERRSQQQAEQPQGNDTAGNDSWGMFSPLAYAKDAADAGLFSTVGGMSRFVGEFFPFGGDMFNSWADAADEVARNNTPTRELTGMDMVGSAVGNAIGSMAPTAALTVVGGGLGSAIGLGAKVAGVASKIPAGAKVIQAAKTMWQSPFGKFLVTNVASSPAEATAEAGNLITEMRSEGYSDDEIRTAALKSAAYNTAWLTVANLLEAKTLGKIADKFAAKQAEKATKMALAQTAALGAVTDAASEGGEEYVQNLIGNYSKGVELNYDEAAEAAKMGAIGGAFLGGAGTGIGAALNRRARNAQQAQAAPTQQQAQPTDGMVEVTPTAEAPTQNSDVESAETFLDNLHQTTTDDTVRALIESIPDNVTDEQLMQTAAQLGWQAPSAQAEAQQQQAQAQVEAQAEQAQEASTPAGQAQQAVENANAAVNAVVNGQEAPTPQQTQQAEQNEAAAEKTQEPAPTQAEQPTSLEGLQTQLNMFRNIQSAHPEYASNLEKVVRNLEAQIAAMQQGEVEQAQPKAEEPQQPQPQPQNVPSFTAETPEAYGAVNTAPTTQTPTPVVNTAAPQSYFESRQNALANGMSRSEAGRRNLIGEGDNKGINYETLRQERHIKDYLAQHEEVLNHAQNIVYGTDPEVVAKSKAAFEKISPIYQAAALDAVTNGEELYRVTDKEKADKAKREAIARKGLLTQKANEVRAMIRKGIDFSDAMRASKALDEGNVVAAMEAVGMQPSDTVILAQQEADAAKAEAEAAKKKAAASKKQENSKGKKPTKKKTESEKGETKNGKSNENSTENQNPTDTVPEQTEQGKQADNEGNGQNGEAEEVNEPVDNAGEELLPPEDEETLTPEDKPSEGLATEEEIAEIKELMGDNAPKRTQPKPKAPKVKSVPVDYVGDKFTNPANGHEMEISGIEGSVGKKTVYYVTDLETGKEQKIAVDRVLPLLQQSGKVESKKSLTDSNNTEYNEGNKGNGKGGNKNASTENGKGQKNLRGTSGRGDTKSRQNNSSGQNGSEHDRVIQGERNNENDVGTIRRSDESLRPVKGSEIANKALDANLKFHMIDNADAEEVSAFFDSLEYTREHDKGYGKAVDSQTKEDLAKYKLIVVLGENGRIEGGLAIKPDGDVVAVHKRPGSKISKISFALGIAARENGGTKMDCYGETLVNFYRAAGFEAVARVDHNKEVAPQHTEIARQKMDVYAMMRTMEDTQTVADRYNNAPLSWVCKQELGLLEHFDLNGYDNAMAFRDNLLAQQENGQDVLSSITSDSESGVGLKKNKMGYVTDPRGFNDKTMVKALKFNNALMQSEIDGIMEKFNASKKTKQDVKEAKAALQKLKTLIYEKNTASRSKAAMFDEKFQGLIEKNLEKLKDSAETVDGSDDNIDWTKPLPKEELSAKPRTPAQMKAAREKMLSNAEETSDGIMDDLADDKITLKEAADKMQKLAADLKQQLKEDGQEAITDEEYEDAIGANLEEIKQLQKEQKTLNNILEKAKQAKAEREKAAKAEEKAEEQENTEADDAEDETKAEEAAKSRVMSKADFLAKFLNSRKGSNIKASATEQEVGMRAIEEVENEIRAALPNAKISYFGRNLMLAALPNSKRIGIQIDDQIILGEEEIRKAAQDHGLSGDDIIIEGSWQRVSAKDLNGFIRLSRESLKGAGMHEVLHMAMDLSLTERERNALLKSAEERAKKDGVDVEEALADMYKEWWQHREGRRKNYHGFGKLWQKIYDFAKHMQSVLTGAENMHDIFRQIESGEVFERESIGREGGEIAANFSARKPSRLASAISRALGKRTGMTESTKLGKTNARLVAIANHQTGYNLQDFDIEIKNNSIQHSEDRHGLRSKDTTRTKNEHQSIDMSTEDIQEGLEGLDRIVDAYMGTPYTENGKKYPVIRFVTNGKNGQYTCSFAIKKGSTQNVLSLVTMWKSEYKNGANPKTPHVANNRNDPQNTSISDNGNAPSENSIAGYGRYGKGNNRGNIKYSARQRTKNPNTVLREDFIAGKTNSYRIGDMLVKRDADGKVTVEQVTNNGNESYDNEGLKAIDTKFKDALNEALSQNANGYKLERIINDYHAERYEYLTGKKATDAEKAKVRAAELRQLRKDFADGKIDKYQVGGAIVTRDANGKEVVKDVTSNLAKRTYVNRRHEGKDYNSGVEAVGDVVTATEHKGKIKTFTDWTKDQWNHFERNWIDKNSDLQKLDDEYKEKGGKVKGDWDTVRSAFQHVINFARGTTEALAAGDAEQLKVIKERFGIDVPKSFKMILTDLQNSANTPEMQRYIAQFANVENVGDDKFRQLKHAFDTYLVAQEQLEGAANHIKDYHRELAEWQRNGSKGKKPQYTEYKYAGNHPESYFQEVVKNTPKAIKDAATGFYRLNDDVLKISEKSGLLSHEKVQEMRNKWKYYCPMLRDFSDTAAEDIIGNTLEHRKSEGSTRDILSPTDAAVKSMANIIIAAERNMAKLKAADRMLEVGSTSLIERVEGDTGDVKNCIVVIKRNGKKEAYRIAQELYPAMSTGYKPLIEMNWGFVTAPAKLLRWGSTSSPIFAVKNFLRDTVFASISSKNGFTPLVDSIRGAIALRSDPKLRAEYEAMGIGGSAMYGSLEGVNAEVDKMRTRDFKSYSWTDIFTGAKALLEGSNDFIEASTRMGEFLKSRAAGNSLEQAAHEAMELTLNFNRSGVEGQQINKSIPFFNACLQGGDKLRRLIRDDPAGTSLRIGTYIMLPSLVLWAANHDKDWYKELDPNVKATYWVFPNGVKIPKPQEAGYLFGTGVEALLDVATGNDPKAMGPFIKAVKDAFFPGVIPTVVLPLLEWQANYSFFREKPIENQRMLRLPEKERYGEYTSELSKAIGAGTNLSPAKLDNFIRSVSGTLGMFAWQAPDNFFTEKRNLPEKKWNENALTRAVFTNDMEMRRTLSDFYELHTAATQQHAAYGKKGKPTREVSAINTAYSSISKLSKQKRDITANPRLNPAEKRQRIDKITQQQKRIASLAVKKFGNKFNI